MEPTPPTDYSVRGPITPELMAVVSEPVLNAVYTAQYGDMSTGSDYLFSHATSADLLGLLTLELRTCVLLVPVHLRFQALRRLITAAANNRISGRAYIADADDPYQERGLQRSRPIRPCGCAVGSLTIGVFCDGRDEVVAGEIAIAMRDVADEAIAEQVRLAIYGHDRWPLAIELVAYPLRPGGHDVYSTDARLALIHRVAERVLDEVAPDVVFDVEVLTV